VAFKARPSWGQIQKLKFEKYRNACIKEFYNDATKGSLPLVAMLKFFSLITKNSDCFHSMALETLAERISYSKSIMKRIKKDGFKAQNDYHFAAVEREAEKEELNIANAMCNYHRELWTGWSVSENVKSAIMYNMQKAFIQISNIKVAALEKVTTLEEVNTVISATNKLKLDYLQTCKDKRERKLTENAMLVGEWADIRTKFTLKKQDLLQERFEKIGFEQMNLSLPSAEELFEKNKPLHDYVYKS